MSFFRKRRLTKIEIENLNLKSEVDALKRKLSVAETEIESMAFVIARDRSRIQAEGAAYARQQAECEGLTNEQSTDESLHRYRA